MVASATGSPLAIATTPRTSIAIVLSLSILASLYSGLLQVRGLWHRRRATFARPTAARTFPDLAAVEVEPLGDTRVLLCVPRSVFVRALDNERCYALREHATRRSNPHRQ